MLCLFSVVFTLINGQVEESIVFDERQRRRSAPVNKQSTRSNQKYRKLKTMPCKAIVYIFRLMILGVKNFRDQKNAFIHFYM